VAALVWSIILCYTTALSLILLSLTTMLLLLRLLTAAVYCVAVMVQHFAYYMLLPAPGKPLNLTPVEVVSLGGQ
jgi:hypothetical protein